MNVVEYMPTGVLFVVVFFGGIALISIVTVKLFRRRNSFFLSANALAKSWGILSLCCLMSVVCHGQDAELQKKLVGTWGFGKFGAMTYSDNGVFDSQIFQHSTNGMVKLNYAGTWAVTNGFLITTITNNVTNNLFLVEPMGSVDRYKILEVTGSRLKVQYRNFEMLYQRIR